MKRIFMPTTGPEDWRAGLADPETQWRTGYSARTLAHCWEEAGGFPREISDLFTQSNVPTFQTVDLLLAIPEYTVPLPGGLRGSQNDLFVLGKDSENQLMAITIEGKVSEPFGPTLEEWNESPSPGKRERLAFILDQLGLPDTMPDTIRYQLLHRTVSAVIEARQFIARSAIMIVHSFSQTDAHIEDYYRFIALFGPHLPTKRLVHLKDLNGVQLYAGWATGDARFLDA